MKSPKDIVFILFLTTVLFSACKRNPLKVDLSKVESEVEVVRFDDKLLNFEGKDTLAAITELSNTYPDFFDLFTYRIIQIGGIGNDNFPDLMKLFITDTLIQDVKIKTDSVFSDRDKIEQQIVKAFKYYSYHFPKKELPTVYTYISGFNQSVVTAENIVGISLDKYLGRDCSYYQHLNTTPQYKILNMRKERMIPEMVYAWGISEFEDPNSATNVLDNIIQKGKIMYLVDAMLPTTPDSLKIGYTTDQLNWCKMNEVAMWTYLIENKMLYSNKRMDIIRYVNDAPSTSGFPIESPGRTGAWIGWQIVRQYMKKHPEVTLEELMKNEEYQQILNESEYDPE